MIREAHDVHCPLQHSSQFLLSYAEILYLAGREEREEREGRRKGGGEGKGQGGESVGGVLTRWVVRVPP